MKEVCYEQDFTIPNDTLFLFHFLTCFQLFHICVSVHSADIERVLCRVLLF